MSAKVGVQRKSEGLRVCTGIGRVGAYLGVICWFGCSVPWNQVYFSWKNSILLSVATCMLCYCRGHKWTRGNSAVRLPVKAIYQLASIQTHHPNSNSVALLVTESNTTWPKHINLKHPFIINILRNQYSKTRHLTGWATARASLSLISLVIRLIKFNLSGTVQKQCAKKLQKVTCCMRCVIWGQCVHYEFREILVWTNHLSH